MVLFTDINNNAHESHNKFSLLIIDPDNIWIESYHNKQCQAENRWKEIYKTGVYYKCIIYDPNGNIVFSYYS